MTLLDNWDDPNLMTSALGKQYSDCWGFKINGSEYGILGSTEGYHFFKITEEGKLNEIDSISGNFQSAAVIHRDIKVYKNYAYLVCDEGPSTMKIVDLSYLPDSVHLVNSGITSRAHNIFIDSVYERLYLCGATHDDFNPSPATSLEIYSLSDPVNPVLLNFWTDVDLPYVHDCFVRSNIAILNCGVDGLFIYDYTDPMNPVFLQGTSIYIDQGYNHQGWLSPDGKTYIFADETQGKRIKKCSVSNNLITIDSYLGTNTANNSVPHNVMINDQFIFIAYYNEGFRIYRYDENSMKEIAYYDTYPEDGPGTMDGAWGVYSELPSGRILVSDRVHGLFLFDFNQDVMGVEPESDVSVFPNPANSNSEVIILIEDGVSVRQINAQLFDINGNIVGEWNSTNNNYIILDIALRAGDYIIEIDYTDENDIVTTLQKSVIVTD